MKAVVWSSICAIVVAVGPLGAGDKGKDDKFDHRAAEGLIQLLGMQLVEYRRLHPIEGGSK